MRYLKLFILLALCLSFFAGCSDDDEEVAHLGIDQMAFENLPLEATTLTLKVSSNTAWSITSNDNWCLPLQTQGEGNAEVTLNVTENLGRNPRTAIVTVGTDDGTKRQTVRVSQKALEKLTDDHRFKLPVVFHVIYADPNNETQNVRKGWLQNILDACNKFYQNSGVDLGLELVMATEDPEGRTLQEPGVHRVQWDIATINSNVFMGYGKTMPQKYVGLIWDPSRYINICLYNFADQNGLGISQFPYVIAPDKLEGLESIPYEAPSSTLDYPHCVSINSNYIYHYQKDAYDSYDVVTTLSHELGHYLGLRHTFSEDDEGGTDACIDSDYCDDTPTYNKAEYDQYYQDYLRSHGGGSSFTQADFDVLVKRKDCLNGLEEFISTNIMDYAISYNDHFTAEQRERVRYVLLHSPFMPGPKYRTDAQLNPSTRSPFKYNKKAYR